jgi:hypothetical protein
LRSRINLLLNILLPSGNLNEQEGTVTDEEWKEREPESNRMKGSEGESPSAKAEGFYFSNYGQAMPSWRGRFPYDETQGMN